MAARGLGAASSAAGRGVCSSSASSDAGRGVCSSSASSAAGRGVCSSSASLPASRGPVSSSASASGPSARCSVRAASSVPSSSSPPCSLSASELSSLAALAERVADASAAVALSHFRRRSLAIDAKSDDSPVTAADRGAEKAMRAVLRSAAPGHAFFGEEGGFEWPAAGVEPQAWAPGDAAQNARLTFASVPEYLWVLDPIDGTKSFVTGKPLFGVLVALLHRGVPVVGVVDAPALGERWVGVAGRATVHKDRYGLLLHEAKDKVSGAGSEETERLGEAEGKDGGAKADDDERLRAPVSLPTPLGAPAPASTAPPPPFGPASTAPPPPFGPSSTAPPPPFGPSSTAPPPPFGPSSTAPPPPFGPSSTAPPPPYASSRPCADVSHAYLYSTSPHMFAPGAERAAFDRLVEACRLPQYGCDCYAYGLLASGCADLVVEADMKPYDIMALVPVVQGAGGKITDWAGRDFVWREREGGGWTPTATAATVLAAGDPHTHAQALEVLAQGGERW